MPLLRAHKPRHAKPSKAAPVLAVGGLTATFSAALVPAANAATDDDFARLRQCESGDNYSINTGNGFYGAYQFDLQTWHGMGLSGRPSDASPATQDGAAHRLQAARGWQPWPACSRKLGLRGDGRASRSRTVTVAKGTRPAVTSTKAPHYLGVLSTAMVHTTHENVRQWQARMKARGWDIAVDGKYGPKSAHIAARFATEKGLKTKAGTVDHKLWTATWVLPIT